MTYETLYAWSGSWGLVLLCTLFVLAVGYALWPANKSKFKDASQQPLNDDDLAPEESAL